MTFVASFTRSYREAQTYLTSVLLVPTLPIAFASIYSLKTKSSLMFIPSLSQHLLMTSVLKDEPDCAARHRPVGGIVAGCWRCCCLSPLRDIGAGNRCWVSVRRGKFRIAISIFAHGRIVIDRV